jgi:hypothetical protein
MNPGWDSPDLRVASDSRRTARYRLLQSWYRQTVLGVGAGTTSPVGRERLVGSRLRLQDVAKRRDLNFLDPKIADYAERRAVEVQREGGSLEPVRLFHNMLSSMPLCFNVFGMIRETPDAQLEFVRQLLDPTAVAVEMIECEWTPGAGLGDRTAFDAAIITRHADASSHLIGIETKYTESFSPTEYESDQYTHVHETSGWFRTGTANGLTGKATNQLWRNCLLAAAAEHAGEYTTAAVVVVSLADDPGADAAIAGLTAAMTDPSRCRLVSLERIVEAAKQIAPLAAWASEFERRYLDLSPIA